MATEIYVCLDLGNDTLKISFAYENNGTETYGKLMTPDLINQVALPSAALYDAATDKWKYADGIDEAEKESFSTVVKIKSLLSLIGKRESAEIEQSNRDYYYNKHYFPKFSFPVRHKMEEDFQYMVNQKLVFEAPGVTPRRMCEDFFRYVKEKIQERIAALSVKTGVQFKELTSISIVHPPKQGPDYVEELSDLITTAFGVKPAKILTSTQALGLFAFYKKYIDENDNLLLFDLGDETVSVSKVWINDDAENKNVSLLIDSAMGHSFPLEMGGSNIDEAIAKHLEKGIHDRETVGSPSADKQGHIFENGLCSEQYLLMKDIKKAKMLMPMAGNGIFKEGVPISIHRETLVQRMLSEKAFSDCIGVNTVYGVAQTVSRYVLEEMRRPGNRDVTKILFAGGMIETHGLREFLKAKLSEQHPYIRILNFQNKTDNNDPYEIQFYETSTYAASVGGAVVAMKNYSVEAALSFSYGTWLYHNNNRKHLELFANRGALLKDEKNYFSIEALIYLSKDELDRLEGDEMFSTVINTKEIERKKYMGQITYEGDWLIIGNEFDAERLEAQDVIDLRVVAGGDDTEIFFYYDGERVALSSREDIQLCFAEGFVIDKAGVATPFFDNVKAKNKKYTICARNVMTNERKMVNASEIEFRLHMSSITVTTNT